MASITTSEIVGGYYVESAERFTFDNGEIVSVSPDTWGGESPLDWGHDVEAFVFRSGYDMTLPDCEGSADAIASAFAEYAGGARPWEERDLLARAVRYARTFHGDTRVARLVRLRGYSQSDWADIVFIGPDADTVAMVANAYGYYFRGDVWSVVSADDSLGGIYADTAEEAANIYAEEMGW